MSIDTRDKIFPLVATSNRDWPEDFGLENGYYQNKCVYCELIFLGYKRRIVCKVCEQNGDIAFAFSELRKASRELAEKVERYETALRKIVNPGRFESEHPYAAASGTQSSIARDALEGK